MGTELCHQSEEWVWPGGFLLFCNTRLLGSEQANWPLTKRDGFHVNVTGGWLSAVAGLVRWRRTPGVAAGVLLMEASNVLIAGAVGGAFAGLVPAMKMRMRRASQLSPDG